MSADEFKAQGNAAFAAKQFDQAVEFFTKAINASPQPNHVLFSNRSGAYASLKDYENALKDADETVKINSQWAKGFNRRGAALHGLNRISEAVEAYDEALRLDPANVQAKQGRQSAEEALKADQNPLKNMFADPRNLMKLQQNPKTRDYLKDPAFMQKLQETVKNPMAVFQQGGASDPRVMEALGVILGLEMPAEDEPMPDQSRSASTSSTSSPSSTPSTANTSSTAKSETKSEAKSEAKSETKSDPASTAEQAAIAAKLKGNELYKQRQFDEAIAKYTEAWELHKDITFLNNRAAAEFEKGDYDSAIKSGLQAVEEALELHSDYKVVAKSLARIGTSYLKKDDLKSAIEYFERSLTEHRSPDVLTKLRNTQRELRTREEQAYINPDLANQARDEGNALFKDGKFPESVKLYSESIKRNPADPRNWANRAASYLKLMNYPDVVRDCDQALALDPKFIKAYTRKATAYNIMKQYAKAMSTLDEARVHDVDGKHLREINTLYSKASSARFEYLPNETEDQRAERLAQDPEIDEIRRDPIMNTILQQAANDPAALKDHMRNPEVARKINLLAAAGIIRTR